MSYTDDRPSPYNLTEEERMDSIRSVALDTGCFVPAHPRTLGANWIWCVGVSADGGAAYNVTTTDPVARDAALDDIAARTAAAAADVSETHAWAIFGELGLHRYATLDPADERPRDLADRALIEVGRRVADKCLLRWRSR